VKGSAEKYGWVSVPVLIKSNIITKVVLQPGWQPPANTAASDVAQVTNRFPIWCRTELSDPQPAKP
jgi:hypothetical protein